MRTHFFGLATAPVVASIVITHALPLWAQPPAAPAPAAPAAPARIPAPPRVGVAQTIVRPARPGEEAVSPIFAALNKPGAEGLEAVRAILAADPGAAKAKRYGTSALGVALGQRSKELVALLLEKGADPNDSEYDSSLVERALMYSSKDIASLLIEKGANLEARDRQGRTMLLRRIADGSREAVEFLLEKNAKVDARDDQGRGALDLAMQSGEESVVRALIAKGVKVDGRDEAGRTPLFTAITRRNAAVVKTLIEKGADVNAVARSGDTPLHLAASAPGAILATLLQSGAKADARNKRGETPLHIALRPLGGEPFVYGPSSDRLAEYDGSSGYPSRPQSGPRAEGALLPLVDKSDVDLKDGLGMSPLLIAIAMRDLEARDLIAERKPKADSTTQLFDAVSQGQLPQLEALLKQKPFLVYFRLPNGMTPLHVSALWGTRGAAETLLDKGADVNARDGQGHTPLMMASARTTGVFTKRARTLATLLLDKKADINARDRNDGTALHRAIIAGDEEMVRLLLSKGAEADARDRTGSSPLHLALAQHGSSSYNGNSNAGDASRASDIALANLLLGAKADPNARTNAGQTVLALAVTSRRKDIVQALLDKGANVDARDASGSTALARLSENAYGSSRGEAGTTVAEIAALLLDKGADPNVRTEYNGESPLLRAVSNGNKELVALFIQKKANLEVRNSSGYTPLMAAVTRGSDNASEIVTLLLTAGADPKAKSQNGETVLKMAQSRNQPAIVELLKAKGATE